MRPTLAALALTLIGGVVPASAASTPRQDALVSEYFAIWDQDRNVTPETVAKLYAPRLIYYGHPMTRGELLDDKRAFIRRWPTRRYQVEPGSAQKSCDADEARCRLSAILAWRTEGPAGARHGRSRVALELQRSDGALKIVREGAVTLGP